MCWPAIIDHAWCVAKINNNRNAHTPSQQCADTPALSMLGAEWPPLVWLGTVLGAKLCCDFLDSDSKIWKQCSTSPDPELVGENPSFLT